MMSTFAILMLLPYLILVLFFYRGFIDGYIGYALNRSSEKKRKKDTTLLDRLFLNSIYTKSCQNGAPNSDAPNLNSSKE